MRVPLLTANADSETHTHTESRKFPKRNHSTSKGKKFDSGGHHQLLWDPAREGFRIFSIPFDRSFQPFFQQNLRLIAKQFAGQADIGL